MDGDELTLGRQALHSLVVLARASQTVRLRLLGDAPVFLLPLAGCTPGWSWSLVSRLFAVSVDAAWMRRHSRLLCVRPWATVLVHTEHGIRMLAAQLFAHCLFDYSALCALPPLVPENPRAVQFRAPDSATSPVALALPGFVARRTVLPAVTGTAAAGSRVTSTGTANLS